MKNLQNVTTTDCVIHFGGLGKGQKRKNYHGYCQTNHGNVDSCKAVVHIPLQYNLNEMDQNVDFLSPLSCGYLHKVCVTLI